MRKGRTSEPGRHYLLTTVTHGRRPLFADPALAMVASRTLSEPRLWRCSRLLCWVLMPDHWHGLLELADEPLDRLMQRVKSVSSGALRSLLVPEVWQPGFHDRALRNDESSLQAARYIIANPLRAGLVERIGDYPWWDAVWVDGGDVAPL
jgi:putative transposase